MKILSVQPDSLYKNGGCGRVLRRLYKGNEAQVTSIYVSENGKRFAGPIKEIKIDLPLFRKPWMRWKLRTLYDYLQNYFFIKKVGARLVAAAKRTRFDVLHVINHGPLSTALVNEELLNASSLWVSFHDHFSLCSTYEDCKMLWEKSDRRLVISEELGAAYQAQFSNLHYEVITDGVEKDELSEARPLRTDEEITIYFGGLLHLDYLPLFNTLADALDLLALQGYTLKMILRGAYDVPFLNDRKFKIDYRNTFVSDAEIKKELDQADILYLPIKLTEPNFYLYSLSTKLIGYLGAPGTILFHGHEESAAGKLLAQNQAAICCTSLDADVMVDKIKELLNQDTCSKNSKALAARQFSMSTIQNAFWNGN